MGEQAELNKEEAEEFLEYCEKYHHLYHAANQNCRSFVYDAVFHLRRRDLVSKEVWNKFKKDWTGVIVNDVGKVTVPVYFVAGIALCGPVAGVAVAGLVTAAILVVKGISAL